MQMKKTNLNFEAKLKLIKKTSRENFHIINIIFKDILEKQNFFSLDWNESTEQKEINETIVYFGIVCYNS